MELHAKEADKLVLTAVHRKEMDGFTAVQRVEARVCNQSKHLLCVLQSTMKVTILCNLLFNHILTDQTP
jgi:hypothetical protein